MELLAALSIVGLMLAAAARPMRMAALGAVEAQTHASQIAGSLRRCRRLSLMTGDAHRLVFTPSKQPTQCQILRGQEEVEAAFVFSRHCAVDPGGDVEFDAMGRADSASEIRCTQHDSKKGRTWVVVTARATGATWVHVDEP